MKFHGDVRYRYQLKPPDQAKITMFVCFDSFSVVFRFIIINSISSFSIILITFSAWYCEAVAADKKRCQGLKGPHWNTFIRCLVGEWVIKTARL